MTPALPTTVIIKRLLIIMAFAASTCRSIKCIGRRSCYLINSIEMIDLVSTRKQIEQK